MSDLDSATAILATASEAAPADSLDSSVTNPADQSDVPPSPAEGAVDSPAVPGEEGSDSPGQKPLPTTAQIRASLKAFREASPEHAQAAKLLNDGYSRYEAYKSEFPTVEEARTVKAQIESVGGLEGLAEMQSVMSSIEETDSLLEAGDPRVLDQIAEDAPEGFKRLAPAYLSKLQKLDPEVFVKTIQPHLVAGLEQAGLPQVLSYLASKLSDKPELADIANQALDWFKNQKQLAERFNSDVLNPERQRIQDEMGQVQKERQEMLQSSISAAVDTHIRQELGGRLRPYSAALNALPMAQREDIARACINTLGAALEADKAYQTQVKAMMGARRPDQAKIIAFNKQKVSALADRVIEAVVKNYGLKAGAAPAPKRGTRGAAPAPKGADNGPKPFVQLSGPPRESEIDWNHQFMNERAFIQHRAILKDGRWVKW